LVFVPGSFAGTADALWLEMEEPTNIVAIDRERDKGVQGTSKVHNFSYTTRSAGDENSQIDIRFIVHFYRRASRENHSCQRRNDADNYSQDASFHILPSELRMNMNYVAGTWSLCAEIQADWLNISARESYTRTEHCQPA